MKCSENKIRINHGFNIQSLAVVKARLAGYQHTLKTASYTFLQGYIMQNSMVRGGGMASWGKNKKRKEKRRRITLKKGGKLHLKKGKRP